MSNKSFNILYVDDEEQNLISFKATFRKDYNVFVANSALHGFEVLKSQNIQLIITDQRMPGITGVEFLERVYFEYPDIIRILLTGFSDIEAVVNAINNGHIYRYITKPWDDTELRMTIENAKQLFELQSANRKLIDELKSKVEEQQKTLNLFTKYVPETIVDNAIHSSSDSLFKGELKYVSVLFCDIRGFTAISEQLEPKAIVELLNDFYAVMSRFIKKYNGSVTQFVGDEIFAVFGAPVSSANTELSATFCALDMINIGLSELNNRYSKNITHEIKVGIGINSGEVIAGNLGCEERIGYSVTGDTVNTGKRIESLTQDYPNTILISQNTCLKIRNHIICKEWEPIAVKGKRDKLVVFEILGKKQ